MVYHLQFPCLKCGLTYPTDVYIQLDDGLAGKSLAEVPAESDIASNVKALMERDDLRCWKGHITANPKLQELILASPPN